MNTQIDTGLEEQTQAEQCFTAEEQEEIAAQEAALDAEEEERRTSRFARGCLEVAALFAGIAAALLLLGQIGICIGYELGLLVLPLTFASGSLIALTVSLFSAYRKTLASFVMILAIWFLVVTYVVTNYQFPEVIPTRLPHEETDVILTQITTPINATLCVDEVLIPGVVSKRFKLPVHPKYIPFGYQVDLQWNADEENVGLYYNEQLWAVYDPEKQHWETVIQSALEQTSDASETD